MSSLYMRKQHIHVHCVITKQLTEGTLENTRNQFMKVLSFHVQFLDLKLDRKVVLIDRHIDSQHKERKKYHQCKSSDKQYKQYLDNLKVHTKSVHDEAGQLTFQCNICQYSVTQKSCLTR